MPDKLQAPFSYFGGKSAVANVIWSNLGCPEVYIEPFFGSGAVLLARPHRGKFETVNDINCFVCNFWRATASDPAAVVEALDWPTIETDLHSRHQWLISQAGDLRQKLEEDPEYFDPRIAGWWCWGICCWIGGDWCEFRSQKRPCLRGQGIFKQDLSTGDISVQDRKRALLDWFGQLRDRLCNVRVCCGHWIRVCSSPTTTTELGESIGIFLDPPYPIRNRDGSRSRGRCYAGDDARALDDLRDEILEYCLQRGEDRRYRICLACYEGDGYEPLLRQGWDAFAWETQGGYSNIGRKPERLGQKNRSRERLYFSPGCRDVDALFRRYK